MRKDNALNTEDKAQRLRHMHKEYCFQVVNKQQSAAGLTNSVTCQKRTGQGADQDHTQARGKTFIL